MVTPVEIASGIVTGGDTVAALAATSRLPDPWTALENAVLPALRRRPCLISFSGGTDSSVVLAVAMDLARRHGLPDPVPCTWRVADAPAAEESAAQQSVIEALGVREWIRLPATDDLDLVAPIARRVLVGGAPYPYNLHLHLPLIELAGGGSLLTGVGGDQILSGWLRPEHRTLARRVKNQLPARVRSALHQQLDSPLPWLRPAVARDRWAARLHELAGEPMIFDERVRFHAGRRALRLASTGLEQLGSVRGVSVINPLVDPVFVQSLARFGAHRPAPRRAELLAMLAPNSVPPIVYARRRKAHFHEVFFREPTRRFVTAWNGDGLDPALVDRAALQRLWSSWPIPYGTGGLVQQAYAATAMNQEVA